MCLLSILLRQLFVSTIVTFQDMAFSVSAGWSSLPGLVGLVGGGSGEGRLLSAL